MIQTIVSIVAENPPMGLIAFGCVFKVLGTTAVFASLSGFGTGLIIAGIVLHLLWLVLR